MLIYFPLSDGDKRKLSESLPPTESKMKTGQPRTVTHDVSRRDWKRPEFCCPDLEADLVRVSPILGTTLGLAPDLAEPPAVK